MALGLYAMAGTTWSDEAGEKNSNPVPTCTIYDMSAEVLQQRFAPYSDELTSLHGQIEAGIPPETIAGFRYTYYDEHLVHSFDLLSGDVGLVFRVDDDIRDEVPLAEHIRYRTGVMERALGHPALEQIVAYSDSEDMPAIITAPNSKYALSYVDDAGLNSIPMDTYARLFATFRTMETLGLGLFVAYMDGIKYPDTTEDSADKQRDLTVTKYMQDPDSSFAGHVLGLGKDLVGATSSSDGEPVPQFAIRYYLACNRYLGKSVGLELIHTWLRRGNSIPQIDYAIE